MSPGITPGETWEAFLIEGKKTGFTRRIIRQEAAGEGVVMDLTTAFQAEGEMMRFHHVHRFSRRKGFPWSSYRFTLPDGTSVDVAFDGKRLHGTTVDGSIDREVPADTVPTYGFFPHVVTMPFEAGKSLQLTGMEDASCELMPQTVLTSVGWEEVEAGGEALRLWRVEESVAGERGNTYWLDEQRRLRKADWQGAESVGVQGRAEALKGLPGEVTKLAE